MADCDFEINVSVGATGQIEFRVPNVTHPCAVRFKINGSSATSGNQIGNINVAQVSADRVTVSAPSGTRIEVEGTMECPPVEVAGDPDYEPCGPTSKSVTHTVGSSSGDDGDGDCTWNSDDWWKWALLPLSFSLISLWPVFVVFAWVRVQDRDWFRKANRPFARMYPWPIRCLFDIKQK